MKKLFANRKLLIIGGAIALLLFGVGYFMVPSGLPKPIQIQLQIGPTQTQPGTPIPAEPIGPVAPVHQTTLRGHGILFSLGERVVNLADPGGYRYLRVSITLEFLPESAEFYRLPPEKRMAEETHFKEELMRQKPIIDDLVISILSSKTFAEIFSLEGKQQLKEELMEQLNASLGDGKYVGAVYFTDFVVQ
ncbi:MAG: flagellar basal body-associated FliL family protein [Anaerolineae bacterium]|nr:flagellar basal body-associated FliL family protein [Anaerolineae bacterium]MDW8099697.1 flagellar basal body-associated FliL family protein [Anaerolineae bacterium]